MKQLVENFPLQLSEAITIGEKFKTKISGIDIQNVLICGLGGSGIGGAIFRDMVYLDAKVPITICNDYIIPAFVNENTLCIGCSYSGNTEETLEAVAKAKKAGAQLAIITSGGKLETFAQKNNYPYIIIPDGMPPRACLGYSLTQLFYVFKAYGLIPPKFIKDLKTIPQFLTDNQKQIRSKAKAIAKKMYGKTPVIYIVDGLESIAIRWRQQINENSKMLTWHHKIPEMNHNELVGWQVDTREDLAPIFITTDYDYSRSDIRVELNKKLIKSKSSNTQTLAAEGKSRMQQAMYLINLGDWLSLDLADMKGVDPMDISVIINLKNNLSKK